MRSKKKALLASLDELAERMPSLLDVDHPCARRNIADARRLIEVFTTFAMAAFLFYDEEYHQFCIVLYIPVAVSFFSYAQGCQIS